MLKLNLLRLVICGGLLVPQIVLADSDNGLFGCGPILEFGKKKLDELKNAVNTRLYGEAWEAWVATKNLRSRHVVVSSDYETFGLKWVEGSQDLIALEVNPEFQRGSSLTTIGSIQGRIEELSRKYNVSFFGQFSQFGPVGFNYFNPVTRSMTITKFFLHYPKAFESALERVHLSLILIEELNAAGVTLDLDWNLQANDSTKVLARLVSQISAQVGYKVNISSSYFTGPYEGDQWALGSDYRFGYLLSSINREDEIRSWVRLNELGLEVPIIAPDKVVRLNSRKLTSLSSIMEELLMIADKKLKVDLRPVLGFHKQ